MRSSALLCASSLALFGCADVRHTARSSQPRDADCLFSLRAEARDSSSHTRRALASSASLTSHEGVSFKLVAEQPAYVYAVHVAPTRERTWLFPFKEDWLLSPKQSLHLPGPEQEYTFDTPGGTEEFLFVASRQPMSEETCAALQLPCQPWSKLPNYRGEGSAPSDGEKPSPKKDSPPASDKKDAKSQDANRKPEAKPEAKPTRGEEHADRLAGPDRTFGLIEGEPEPAIRSFADARGVAVLRLKFLRVQERPLTAHQSEK